MYRTVKNLKDNGNPVGKKSSRRTPHASRSLFTDTSPQLTVWRDPVYREEFPTLVTFSGDAQGRIRTLSMQLNRDRMVGTKPPRE
jgi:hypothetical protein